MPKFNFRRNIVSSEENTAAANTTTTHPSSSSSTQPSPSTDTTTTHNKNEPISTHTGGNTTSTTENLETPNSTDNIPTDSINKTQQQQSTTTTSSDEPITTTTTTTTATDNKTTTVKKFGGFKGKGSFAKSTTTVPSDSPNTSSSSSNTNAATDATSSSSSSSTDASTTPSNVASNTTNNFALVTSNNNKINKNQPHPTGVVYNSSPLEDVATEYFYSPDEQSAYRLPNDIPSINNFFTIYNHLHELEIVLDKDILVVENNGKPLNDEENAVDKGMKKEYCKTQILIGEDIKKVFKIAEHNETLNLQKIGYEQFINKCIGIRGLLMRQIEAKIAFWNSQRRMISEIAKMIRHIRQPTKPVKPDEWSWLAKFSGSPDTTAGIPFSSTKTIMNQLRTLINLEHHERFGFKSSSGPSWYNPLVICEQLRAQYKEWGSLNYAVPCGHCRTSILSLYPEVMHSVESVHVSTDSVLSALQEGRFIYGQLGIPVPICRTCFTKYREDESLLTATGQTKHNVLSEIFGIEPRVASRPFLGLLIIINSISSENCKNTCDSYGLDYSTESLKVLQIQYRRENMEILIKQSIEHRIQQLSHRSGTTTKNALLFQDIHADSLLQMDSVLPGTDRTSVEHLRSFQLQHYSLAQMATWRSFQFRKYVLCNFWRKLVVRVQQYGSSLINTILYTFDDDIWLSTIFDSTKMDPTAVTKIIENIYSIYIEKTKDNKDEIKKISGQGLRNRLLNIMNYFSGKYTNVQGTEPKSVTLLQPNDLETLRKFLAIVQIINETIGECKKSLPAAWSSIGPRDNYQRIRMMGSNESHSGMIKKLNDDSVKYYEKYEESGEELKQLIESLQSTIFSFSHALPVNRLVCSISSPMAVPKLLADPEQTIFNFLAYLFDQEIVVNGIRRFQSLDTANIDKIDKSRRLAEIHQYINRVQELLRLFPVLPMESNTSFTMLQRKRFDDERSWWNNIRNKLLEILDQLRSKYAEKYTEKQTISANKIIVRKANRSLLNLMGKPSIQKKPGGTQNISEYEEEIEIETTFAGSTTTTTVHVAPDGSSIRNVTTNIPSTFMIENNLTDSIKALSLRDHPTDNNVTDPHEQNNSYDSDSSDDDANRILTPNRALMNISHSNPYSTDQTGQVTVYTQMPKNSSVNALVLGVGMIAKRTSGPLGITSSIDFVPTKINFLTTNADGYDVRIVNRGGVLALAMNRTTRKNEQRLMYITTNPSLPVAFLQGACLRRNASGTFVALFGPSGVAIISLPGADILRQQYEFFTNDTHEDAYDNNEHITPVPAFMVSTAIHATAAPLEVRWHPLQDNYLCVLSADALRIYDVRSSNTQHGIFESLPFIDEIRVPVNMGKNGPYSSRIDPSQPNAGSFTNQVASFTFGIRTEGWDIFAIYFVTKDGSIYTLCPYIPPRCVISAELWRTLFTDSTLPSLEMGPSVAKAVDTENIAERWLHSYFEHVQKDRNVYQFIGTSNHTNRGNAGYVNYSSMNPSASVFSPMSISALKNVAQPYLQAFFVGPYSIMPQFSRSPVEIRDAPACDIHILPSSLFNPDTETGSLHKSASSCPYGIMIAFADGLVLSLLNIIPMIPVFRAHAYPFPPGEFTLCTMKDIQLSKPLVITDASIFCDLGTRSLLPEMNSVPHVTGGLATGRVPERFNTPTRRFAFTVPYFVTCRSQPNTVVLVGRKSAYVLTCEWIDGIKRILALQKKSVNSNGITIPPVPVERLRSRSLLPKLQPNEYYNSTSESMFRTNSVDNTVDGNGKVEKRKRMIIGISLVQAGFAGEIIHVWNFIGTRQEFIAMDKMPIYGGYYGTANDSKSKHAALMTNVSVAVNRHTKFLVTGTIDSFVLFPLSLATSVAKMDVPPRGIRTPLMVEQLKKEGETNVVVKNEHIRIQTIKEYDTKIPLLPYFEGRGLIAYVEEPAPDNKSSIVRSPELNLRSIVHDFETQTALLTYRITQSTVTPENQYIAFQGLMNNYHEHYAILNQLRKRITEILPSLIDKVGVDTATNETKVNLGPVILDTERRVTMLASYVDRIERVNAKMKNLNARYDAIMFMFTLLRPKSSEEIIFAHDEFDRKLKRVKSLQDRIERTIRSYQETRQLSVQASSLVLDRMIDDNTQDTVNRATALLSQAKYIRTTLARQVENTTAAYGEYLS